MIRWLSGIVAKVSLLNMGSMMKANPVGMFELEVAEDCKLRDRN